ncbi:MAG: M15 family metallopeptidase [Oscillospiraceae bacterium]|nr:M15 family metallopeptidase [Oscillospiraceae bacterium]
MRKSYRGRRRRGLHPIVLIVPLALAGVFFLGQMRNRAPAGDSPAPPPADTPAVQGDQSPLPEHASTSSGAGCTLTELGEEAIYTGNLILVNNQILYRFPEEQELVNIYEEKISGYYVRDMEVFLAPAAMEALNRLLAAFLENGGSETINVVAGYRDAEFQQHLFDQSAQRNGEEHAKKYVAQPGGSEHHTGLVVDLSVLKNGVSQDYDGTGEYAWINENCRDYGWVVRYESGKEELTGIWDEPWHFRYVGVPHATEMARQGMCLEEYMEYLRRFPFDGEHLTIQCADGTYEVWYTQGTRAYLPDSGEYEVSGNNVDGVIVTRKVG